MSTELIDVKVRTENFIICIPICKCMRIKEIQRIYAYVTRDVAIFREEVGIFRYYFGKYIFFKKFLNEEYSKPRFLQKKKESY